MNATAIDKPPKRMLGLREKVKSPEDVDRALETLAYMASKQKTADARVDARCRLVKAEESKNLSIKIGEKEMPFADLRELLEGKIAEYVLEHRENFFPPNMKTRVFTYGKVSSKVQPERVEYLDGGSPDSVMERIEKKSGVLAKIFAVLDKLRLFDLPLVRLVTVKASLNLNAVKAAVKSNEIRPDELKSIGIEIVRPEEKLAIEPTEYFVQSELSE